MYFWVLLATKISFFIGHVNQRKVHIQIVHGSLNVEEFVALTVNSAAINTLRHTNCMHTKYLTKTITSNILMYFSVCTRPTTRRCSIHYAKNCIFGEACAVDVLNADPWFSLGSVFSIQFVVQFLYPKTCIFSGHV